MPPRRPVQPAPGPDGYEARLLLPGDAPGVRACTLAVHGDDYPRTELYCPEEIVRRNDTNEWISAVAVDASGTVLGHTALELSPRGPIAEIGMGMVLPAHRRRGILEVLRGLLVEECLRRGIDGRFAEVDVANAGAQGLV